MAIFTEATENEYVACSPPLRRWTGLAYSFAILEAFFGHTFPKMYFFVSNPGYIYY